MVRPLFPGNRHEPGTASPLVMHSGGLRNPRVNRLEAVMRALASLCLAISIGGLLAVLLLTAV